MPIPYSESDQASRGVPEHHYGVGKDESEPSVLPDLQCGPSGAEGRRNQKYLFWATGSSLWQVTLPNSIEEKKKERKKRKEEDIWRNNSNLMLHHTGAKGG